MREITTEVAVCREARQDGWYVTPKVGFGARGWPDRLFIRACNGFFEILFIEFKAPGKKPSRLQRLVHKKLRKLGFPVYVVDNIPTGLEIVSRRFARLPTASD